MLRRCAKDAEDGSTRVGVVSSTQLKQRFLPLDKVIDSPPTVMWHLRTQPYILNWALLEKGPNSHLDSVNA